MHVGDGHCIDCIARRPAIGVMGLAFLHSGDGAVDWQASECMDMYALYVLRATLSDAQSPSVHSPSDRSEYSHRHAVDYVCTMSRQTIFDPTSFCGQDAGSSQASQLANLKHIQGS